ncbi:MAG: hypothetical protein FJW35_09020 [Acidobacteria bacterium]|nr:hypothetical protein [Acidobacteriota bacterium]
MEDGQYYEAQQGDCISSIAEEHGMSWEAVWRHANNAELRQRRRDPNVLSPGDRVFIPALRAKHESRATEQRHTFRRKGAPAKLRIRFLDADGQPRAGLPYVLNVDGKLTQDRTDSDGCVVASIPPNARKGLVRLRDGDREEICALALGAMDPVGEKTGARKRLENLGYDCGHDDEAFDLALRSFQLDEGLESTGQPDDPTQQALLRRHGC